MRSPTTVWWVIMQVRLESTKNTWDSANTCTCKTTLLGTKHYSSMLQLGSRQGMRCPTRVWCVIMQVLRVNYKHMITNTCMLHLGSRQGHRCPSRVWWEIMQVRRVNYKHMRSPILAHAPTRVSWVTKLCMLQLGSRQRMRCPSRVWWAIMQVRLESTTNTWDHQYLHAQQHYWELNIIVACSN